MTKNLKPMPTWNQINEYTLKYKQDFVAHTWNQINELVEKENKNGS